ncbi:hapless 2-B, putative [Babesia ovata]|uniref:Hapless 2-B, putative n=1 Tax=Babesia ovata TaxID=189622 RepID=A0A2H6KA92_9APIC|nr:hapless 2-B, putative [Babesia ovata]GBE59917.1 hapless 2-B, putative [Babesia ovata]
MNLLGAAARSFVSVYNLFTGCSCVAHKLFLKLICDVGEYIFLTVIVIRKFLIKHLPHRAVMLQNGLFNPAFDNFVSEFRPAERFKIKIHLTLNPKQTFATFIFPTRTSLPLDLPNLIFNMLENLINSLQRTALIKLPAKHLNRRVNIIDLLAKWSLDLLLKLTFKPIRQRHDRLINILDSNLIKLTLLLFKRFQRFSHKIIILWFAVNSCRKILNPLLQRPQILFHKTIQGLNLQRINHPPYLTFNLISHSPQIYLKRFVHVHNNLQSRSDFLLHSILGRLRSIKKLFTLIL